MACPICEKRKAKRFCPARGENICSVCCGTEREVTIDCPSDCPHLVASREYDFERFGNDWSKAPFSETRIPTSFVTYQTKLILSLSYQVCAFARDHRELVDSDVSAALIALAEAYRTLSRGIYYEKPPDYVLQRGLYEAVKTGIADYKKAESRDQALSSTRDAEIRDALIFLAQIGTLHMNGRPKGRAYLDFLRTQFSPQEFSQPKSNIVLLS